MDQKKIGGFIAKLRKEKNLTQREISEKLGISEKTISKWECGNGLPKGIGTNFLQYRKPEYMIKSFRNSLQIAVKNGDNENADDIREIMDILNHFPDYVFDVSKFTCGNTHGDYMISQFICGDNSIKGIIDWTTACRHPLVWEVVFLFPGCM